MMFGRNGAPCWAVITLVLCLGFRSAVSLELNNCPGDINGTRSELVYWSPPTVTGVDFSVTGIHQPGRYYFEDTTVTYTAQNATDTITCTFDIIIQDNGSPVITSCPEDTSASAPVGSTQVSVTWTAPVVADPANVAVSSDKSPGDLFGLGRNTVTYTFTDTNDNNAPSSYCAFDVFVQESASTSSPNIDCPDTITVTLGLGEQSMAVTWDDPVYQGIPGSVTTACTRRKNDQFFEGSNTIGCVGYFEDGATGPCFFDVNVAAFMDSESPSILNCPSNINMYVAPAATGAMVSWTEPEITDNTQQDITLVADHTNGDFYNVGNYRVTYTGSDASDNEVTCSFDISVIIDNVPPFIHDCPAPSLEHRVPEGTPSALVSWVEPTATDNSGQMVTPQGPTGPLMNGGEVNLGETLSVSYVATDQFGNSQNCDFTVMLVVDEAPEYAGCSTDMTVQTPPGASYANVTWPEPSVTDDSDSLTLTKSHEPGMNYPIGVFTVRYTATDNFGNIGICSFVVTVEDNEDPTLGPCPPSQTFTLGQSENSVEYTWTNPSATDNSCDDTSDCDTVLTVTSDMSPGSFARGTHMVTVTASDPSGNTDTCDFTITVNPYVPDTEQPMWDICPGDISENTNSGEPTFTATWRVPLSSDNGRIVSTFVSHTPPFAFPIGTNTVTYRAVDEAGNEGTCTFDVIVTDNEIPVWTADTGCDTTTTYYVRSGTANLEVAVPTPAATDNSGVVPTITSSLTNPNAARFSFPNGESEIQFTATDGSGNQNTGNCPVTVDIREVTDFWSVQGTVILTHIRGITGEFSDASAPQLLSELEIDMDRLFRGSDDIGSHFVGVDVLSHVFVNGNPRVTFELYFTRERQGRHTSRQITEAFYAALTSSLTFATNNFVIANSFMLNVREFKFTSRLIGLDNPSIANFVSLYDDPTSIPYTSLEDRINRVMDIAYLNNFAYKVSVVVDFRDGSIINDVILVFDDTSSATEDDIRVLFNNKLGANGRFENSDLYFDQVPAASNQELCPDDECLNGGTCTVDVTYTNVCTCPDGFSGTNCETEAPTAVLSPLAIAAIIVGGVLFLLLLFALFCCFIYFCREPVGRYKDDRYPLDRPFQIIDDEASVASSMDVFLMPRARPKPPGPLLALPPPPAPVLSLPRPPPPEAPTLRLDNDMLDMYPLDGPTHPLDGPTYPLDGPSFSPDGEVYVTGPNQVAIRPSTKRSRYYRY